jgi:hypothetical protein
MKAQDVILKALSGELQWFRVGDHRALAEDLGVWCERYLAYGYDGLVSRRQHYRFSAPGSATSRRRCPTESWRSRPMRYRAVLVSER